MTLDTCHHAESKAEKLRLQLSHLTGAVCPNFHLSPQPRGVKCIGSQCGSYSCRSSAADVPLDDNANSSWAHTDASRL
jgi:hypothetical protein